MTKSYLEAVSRCLSDDNFGYSGQIATDGNASLEFEVMNDDLSVNGIDLISRNRNHKIDFFAHKESFYLMLFMV